MVRESRFDKTGGTPLFADALVLATISVFFSPNDNAWASSVSSTQLRANERYFSGRQFHSQMNQVPRDVQELLVFVAFHVYSV